MQHGIEANGGVIEGGWFVLDQEVLRLLRGCYGPAVPERVPLEPRWCNPTPPIAPTLGGHSDPKTGHYCHPERIPWEWSMAWSTSGRDAPPWKPLSSIAAWLKDALT